METTNAGDWVQTESAREARKSFYCELCQKGYSRINEFEAHESSYDHSHKKVCRVRTYDGGEGGTTGQPATKLR